MIGSDDVLACFIAGNAFTWDDWFRLETEDDSLQPTIDMLLNVSVFMWFGAVCPWHKFVANDVIPVYRLIPLGIMVLLFRRVPMVLAFHKFIHQIEDIRHALFVGFFGPIGVSAIFYLYIAREFLLTVSVNGQEREDALRLAEIMDVVIWFLVICSITVHGLSIPLGKLGFYLPRTISTALSSERVSASQSMARRDSREPEPFHLREHAQNEERSILKFFRRRTASKDQGGIPASNGSSLLPRGLLRAGKHIVNDIGRPQGATAHGENGVQGEDHTAAKEKGSVSSDSGVQSSNDNGGAHPEISGPTDGRVIGHAINNDNARVEADQPTYDLSAAEQGRVLGSGVQTPAASGTATPTNQPVGWQRSIRFPDEPRFASSPKPESPIEEHAGGLSPLKAGGSSA